MNLLKALFGGVPTEYVRKLPERRGKRVCASSKVLADQKIYEIAR
ncbi:hypothetical protein GA0061099_10175 [Bradyrhizobium yuanmingense]|uniref:Uncharacterized protein n=1 Tax=Bradyrhizobium yuanmingense TaxID=108015 RepID=A0A1C3XGT6_9BRAD|nr:hypothetical protein IQ15_07107 [Bradyrhizobium yuanmingense]SCB51296.1 hypothetical protein GA0061099_10175 [Bradyrhizobium yuanmingense]